MNPTTRFAPSPSGRLHLGHAYSALQAWNFAKQNGGQFILRIEDIDINRCKPAFESQLKEDLRWLGFLWPEPARRQSEHLSDYLDAAALLKDAGWLYPCFCTRKAILTEIERSGGAPHGSEGPVYPGTCRELSQDQREAELAKGNDHAWRLNLSKALEDIGSSISWHDLHESEIKVTEADWSQLGDVVLLRKDIGTSYHLAVVVDDALQKVTHVIRGKDLYESSHIHALLQRKLDLPAPKYHHHGLIADENGKRLAKRDESQTLAALRARGVSPCSLIDQLNQAPVV